MAQDIDDGLVSVEEYLEMEERSEVRHEYVAGMLYAMTGGSHRHNRIAFNIARKLADAADDGPCSVYIADMRFLIGSVYYYPDVMVACEPPEIENPIWRTNPCLVVEVLSPSSESIDPREKLLAYRGVPTVETYLIVHQDV
jgi:Uma2 family endonuclease